MRQGDFSAFSGADNDPLSGNAFPGNIIPASRVNPVTANLINNYTPLPNVGGAVNYAGVTRNIINIDQGIGRADHYFSEKDQAFIHYIYARRDYPSYDLNPNFHYNATFP